MMFDRISDGLWWDKAWSLVSGCTPVSPACDNCWAAAQTSMRSNHPNDRVMARNAGLTSNGNFNRRIRLNHEFLDKPLRTKKPTAWAVWNDLFHEDVPEEFLLKVFSLMTHVSAQRHTFLVLTKRPERMRRFINSIDHNDFHWPAKNVWLGTTAENQQTADERIPLLLQTPAAVRFVSVEPMLGPVDLTNICLSRTAESSEYFNALSLEEWTEEEAKEAFGDKYLPPLDWVICGGESGPHARPMSPEWARSLRDECQAAGTSFFFKQWGEWFPRDQWEHNPELILPDDEFAYHDSPKTHVFKDLNDLHPVHRVGKKAAGRLLDGQEWLEIPEVERC